MSYVKKVKNLKSIKTQCDACGGTGIYSGFMEAEGEGVVCVRCGGTGCRVIEYFPFKGRKRRKDIKTVVVGRGTASILESNLGKQRFSYRTWFKLTEK